eukprot:3872204-Rhodomonas_salina.2
MLGFQGTAALVVVLAAFTFLGLKFGTQQWVRFDVIGPKVDRPSEVELSALLSASSLLCVGCTRGIGAGYAKAACT